MQRSPERAEPLPGATRSRVGRLAVYATFLVGLFVLWEGLKFIGGDPWRYFGWTWQPPLKITTVNDQIGRASCRERV